MIKISAFSRKQVSKRNEDAYGYDGKTFVVADGVTDKSGERYNKKTGGEIAANIVVKRCLASSKNGRALVKELNAEVKKVYKKLCPAALKDWRYRFAAVFCCARIVGKDLVMTQVGNVGFRVNGGKIYKEDELVSSITGHLRSFYIQKTGDIKGAREYMMPLLVEQFKLHNDPKHVLGFGVIEGLSTPAKFIKTYKFPLKNIKTLEIFTDGYYDVPKVSTVKAWEELHKQVNKLDPYKYKKYKSTKSEDDRTVMIVRF
ncbi:MAG: hypothetical protein ABIE94_04060 [archaeon]